MPDIVELKKIFRIMFIRRFNDKKEKWSIWLLLIHGLVLKFKFESNVKLN